MSLEDLINSLKEGKNLFKKKLIPIVVGSTLFYGICSSSANEPPIVEWEKSFSFPNQTITLPIDIKQYQSDNYFFFGLTENPRGDMCHPLFSSKFSPIDSFPLLVEKFGSCKNVYSRIISPEPDKFMIGTLEYYFDDKTEYTTEINLITFDDNARILSKFPLPQNSFISPYFLLSYNEDIYAFGLDSVHSGIKIIGYDSNMNLKPDYPKQILTDKLYHINTVNAIDDKILITASRNDPQYYPSSLSTSFIKLDSNFNVESVRDYEYLGIPEGNIEKLDEGYIFAASIFRTSSTKDIAIFRTDINGDLLPSYPKELDLGTDYLINFSKNPENNFTILSSQLTFNYTPALTAIDKDSNILWHKAYTNPIQRLITGWDITSDGGYVLTGREGDPGAFILKLSPEIFTPTIYDPIGIHGGHFKVNIDGYNFESWQPTPEENQNQFIEFIKNIIDSYPQAKVVSDEEISSYYPLIVPYLENIPDKNTFGMSLSSTYYFTDPLYFLEGGVGVQMPTYDRDLDDEPTKAKINREQKKFPLVVMARNAGVISDSSSKEKLIDILSHENEPALLNLTNSEGQTKTVVAYKLQINHDDSVISIYDPDFPSQEKSAQIDSLGNISYENYPSCFVEDISWLSAGGTLKETLDIVKERYLDDLIRSGIDIVTIFPETISSKLLSNNFLFVDSIGRKYGYENSNFFDELPIIQKTLFGFTYFTIPSSLEYELFLSNPSNQNLSIVNSSSSAQTFLYYSNINSLISTLSFSSDMNSLFYDQNGNQTIIPPTISQENTSIYDLDKNKSLDSNDLFSLSNEWTKNSGQLKYNQNYLLEFIEHLQN